LQTKEPFQQKKYPEIMQRSPCLAR